MIFRGFFFYGDLTSKFIFLGRLTLTNYAVYFEAMGVITYDDALKIDLSENISHTVKPAATGPWGAPLFDKAIIYESPEL
jgi:hypothetical protein